MRREDAKRKGTGQTSASGVTAESPRRRRPASVRPRVTRQPSRERSSLMHVGRRVDYAVRALAYLAGQDSGRVVGSAEIEARQGIPRHFLSKILRTLVATGILESVPGAHGGFHLRRRANEITLRQVYAALEGDLCLIDCLRNPDGACCFASVCTQIEVWRGAQRVLLEYLDGISIAAVADGYGLRPRLGARASAIA